MEKDKGYRVEYVALSEIQRWPRNPKMHDEKGIDESLERFGFTEPLVLDEKSGKLVAGHGRLEALQRRKAAGAEPPARVGKKGQEWLVPVLRGISFKDVNEAEAYLLASNRLVEIGGWDEKSLAEILLSLNSSSSLAGTGYAESDVEGLYRQVQAAAKPVVGATPEDLLPKYMNAAIRQVVLYFGDEYDSVMARLDTAQKTFAVDNNTAVLLKLLEHWEKAQSP